MINCKTIFIPLMLASCVLSLSACGWQLRGSQQANNANPYFLAENANNKVFLQIKGKDEGNVMRSALQKELMTLGVVLADNAEGVNEITIDSIKLQKYELVGVLTEIRLVMTVEVSYQVWKEGRLQTTKQVLQVERSYQHNKASVSFGNRQSKRVKAWLYKDIAQQITEQYFALNAG
ncbi:MAG: hypothetical protein KGV51_08550 [Moraxellaceae bacterium]|nr:hypothetical protein [Moraxellaceae bacterium]